MSIWWRLRLFAKVLLSLIPYPIHYFLIIHKVLQSGDEIKKLGMSEKNRDKKIIELVLQVRDFCIVASVVLYSFVTLGKALKH